jgi:hypothetical protein
MRWATRVVKTDLLSQLGVIVMSKTLLATHVLSVVIACSLLVYRYRLPFQIAHVDPRLLMSQASMGVFAGIGAITGFWLMSKRQGKSESMVLAASTVIAVLLLIIAVTLPILVV